MRITWVLGWGLIRGRPNCHHQHAGVLAEPHIPASIWTPAALSDAHALAGICWRVVEAQHHVSTMKLVDTNDEQEVLEDLIEFTKPVVPRECSGLDYLLSTPFRYGAPYPTGSRFRRPGMTDGVFYAAATPQTAVAEMAFYRLLFFAESPHTPWPSNPAEYTAFSAKYATEKAIDLTVGKYAADMALWTHATDYSYRHSLMSPVRTKLKSFAMRQFEIPDGERTWHFSHAAPSQATARRGYRLGVFTSAKRGFKQYARRRNRVLHSTAIVSRRTPALRTCAGFAPKASGQTPSHRAW
jgi:hypothetical protein